MSETLNAVRNAIDNGNYARAREVLRPVLRENTSAEAWVLAAQLTDSREKKQQFLRRALAIDPMHLEADRQQVLLDDIAREFAYTPVTPRRRRFPVPGWAVSLPCCWG